MTGCQPVIFSRKSNRIAAPLKFAGQAALIIGDEGYRAAFLDRRRHMRSIFAPASVEGRERVVAWLKASKIRKLRIICDQTGQSYAREDIPNAKKSDREKLLQRRLTSRFGDRALTTSALVAAADKDGSTTRPYLLAGISDGGPVEIWFEELATVRIEVTSVSLLPLEWAAIRPDFTSSPNLHKASRNWRMIVTRHRTGGIRHVVLLNEQLVLTRLTSVPAGFDDWASEPDSTGGDRESPPRALPQDRWVDEFVNEIEASIGYVRRFGYTADQKLEVILLGGNAFAEVVRLRTARIPSPSPAGSPVPEPVWSSIRTTDYLDRLQVIHREGDERLFGGDAEKYACGLVALLLSSQTANQPLRSDFLHQYAARERNRRLVQGAAAASIIGLGGWSVWLGHSVYQQTNMIASLELQLQASQMRHEELSIKSAALPADLANGRELVRVHDQQRATGLRYSDFHQDIVAALRSDLRVQRLRFDSDEAAVARQGTTQQPNAGNVHSSAGDLGVENAADSRSQFSPTAQSPASRESGARLELQFDMTRADDIGVARSMADQFFQALTNRRTDFRIDLTELVVPLVSASDNRGSWSAGGAAQDAVPPLSGRIAVVVYQP